VKNINSTHRVEGIKTQFGIKGALKEARANLKTWAQSEAAQFPTAAH
jgi:hypothetical protein